MIAGLTAFFLSAAAPAAAEAPPCTRESAVQMTVEQVVARGERLLRRCVTVEVMAGGRSLYSGREGEYLAARVRRWSDPHRIGYYPFADGASPEALPPGRYLLTGIVMSCRALQRLLEARNDDPELFPMVGGYYHHYAGAVIMPVFREALPPEPEFRFVGEPMRARYGNLEAAPANWPALPRLRLAAEAYRRAILAGDREALRDFHDFPDEGVDPDIDMFVTRMASDPSAPFADLRGPGAGALAIFIEFAPLRRPVIAPGEEHGAWFCFCRSAECEGLWPISSIDAGAREGRPYVCTWHEPRYGAPDLTATFNTWEEPNAPVEQVRSAFRR